MPQRIAVRFSFKGTLQLSTAGSATILMLLFIFNGIPDLFGKVTPVDRATGHLFHFRCIEHFHFFFRFQDLPFVAGLLAYLSRCVRCTLRCCVYRGCFRWEQYSRRRVTEASLPYPLRQLLIITPAQPGVHTDLFIDHPVVSGTYCSSVRGDADDDRILHNHGPDGAEAA